VPSESTVLIMKAPATEPCAVTVKLVTAKARPCPEFAFVGCIAGPRKVFANRDDTVRHAKRDAIAVDQDIGSTPRLLNLGAQSCALGDTLLNSCIGLADLGACAE